MGNAFRGLGTRYWLGRPSGPEDWKIVKGIFPCPMFSVSANTRPRPPALYVILTLDGRPNSFDFPAYANFHSNIMKLLHSIIASQSPPLSSRPPFAFSICPVVLLAFRTFRHTFYPKFSSANIFYHCAICDTYFY
jgi:hypothetical protein